MAFTRLEVGILSSSSRGFGMDMSMAALDELYSTSSRVADVVPHWERKYGRYWIRSQVVHFLWKPADWLQQEINRRLEHLSAPIALDIQGHSTDGNVERTLTQRPILGIHVRNTDNVPDLAKDFGRNATITRQLDHYWQMAQTIARRHRQRCQDGTNHNCQHQSELKDVFVATDHTHVVEWASQIFQGWTIWSQSSTQVPRSTTQDRVWFADGRSKAAAAMATDLEVLRRADYLIGSFQSNVYRLAAELNTAFHVATYSVHEPRHFSVDVEWYEDP